MEDSETLWNFASNHWWFWFLSNRCFQEHVTILECCNVDVLVYSIPYGNETRMVFAVLTFILKPTFFILSFSIYPMWPPTWKATKLWWSWCKSTKKHLGLVKIVNSNWAHLEGRNNQFHITFCMKYYILNARIPKDENNLNLKASGKEIGGGYFDMIFYKQVWCLDGYRRLSLSHAPWRNANI